MTQISSPNISKIYILEWMGLILENDMQTHPNLPPPLKSGPIEFLVSKDVQCSETYA